MRKSVKLGKHVIQLWVIAIVCTSIIATGVFANYAVSTLSVPLEVGEPLEVLSFPSQVMLYPGESQEFEVTINNSASATYTILITCSLDNATYQEKYATLSNESYKISPGQHNMLVWLSVDIDAPSVAATLNIDVRRITLDQFND